MKTKSLKWMLLTILGLLIGLDAQAFYNPSSGRWLSRDPIDERGHLTSVGEKKNKIVVNNHNPYWFVKNNPVTLFDGDGRDFQSDQSILTTLATMAFWCARPESIDASKKYNWPGSDKLKHC